MAILVILVELYTSRVPLAKSGINGYEVYNVAGSVVLLFEPVRSIVALSYHTGITEFNPWRMIILCGIGLEIILISAIVLTVLSRQERRSVFESIQQWVRRETE